MGAAPMGRLGQAPIGPSTVEYLVVPGRTGDLKRYQAPSRRAYWQRVARRSNSIRRPPEVRAADGTRIGSTG